MPKPSPKSPAAIVPFPLARRRAFIGKHAARMADLPPRQAEAYLSQQLRVQGDTLRRRGIAESAIAREIRSLESTIRAELWRCVITPGRPAS
jgi:hypothetical protein